MSESRDYRLIARIAEADFGETWRAAASCADGPVAATVKFLSPRFDHQEILGRLASRVTRCQTVDHPGIVVPWQFGAAGDRYALTSAFVEGYDLTTVFARLRAREIALPLPRAVHIMAEAANAVSALHEVGIVHGSLGPSDIFVTFDGSVKVVAAGLRLALAGANDTRHLALRGRKAYRAPEMARNSPVDAQCDVYALGSILYEMITGKSLEGQRSASTRSDTLDPPSRADRRIPSRFDTVVMKALETARTRRYKDAPELRDALWAYLDDMGLVVTPAELSEFANHVMPNEVVRPRFDPKERVSGNPPVPGSFRITVYTPPAAPPKPRSYGLDAPAAQPDPSDAPTPAPASGRPGPNGAIEAPSPRAHPQPPKGMMATAPSEWEVEGETGKVDWSAAPRTEVATQVAAAAPDTLVGAAPTPDFEDGVGDDTAVGSIFEAPDPPLEDAPDDEPPATPAPPRDGRTALEVPVPPGERPAPVPRDPPVRAPPAPTRPEAFTALLRGRPRTDSRMYLWMGLGGVGLAVLVGIGASLAGLIHRGGSTPERSEPVPAVATPISHLPSLAPTPVTPPKPPPVVEAVATVEAAADPPPAKRQAKRRRKRRAPAAASGYLTIYASHRARVFIDGNDTGEFTPLKRYEVPAGIRRITLIHPESGVTRKKKVRVRRDKTREVKMSLQ